MKLTLVVAATENNVIGKNNQLLWHLPNDLRFFKNVTWAMPVIMGRKTFESISRKPLPGRYNIIVTSKNDLKPESGEIILAENLQSAIEKAGSMDCLEAFIAGGGEIFRSAMEIADGIYMTRVRTTIEGDTFFPEIDPQKWKLIWSEDHPADEKHAYPYSFQFWKRTN